MSHLLFLLTTNLCTQFTISGVKSLSKFFRSSWGVPTNSKYCFSLSRKWPKLKFLLNTLLQRMSLLLFQKPVNNQIFYFILVFLFFALSTNLRGMAMKLGANLPPRHQIHTQWQLVPPHIYYSLLVNKPRLDGDLRLIFDFWHNIMWDFYNSIAQTRIDKSKILVKSKLTWIGFFRSISKTTMNSCALFSFGNHSHVKCL